MREDVIGHVSLVSQIGAQVVVEYRVVGRHDGGFRGIVERGVQQAVGIGSGISSIQPPDPHFLIYQQVVCELGHVNAQIGLVNHFLAQSGVARHLLDCLLALFRRKGIAFGQRLHILP